MADCGCFGGDDSCDSAASIVRLVFEYWWHHVSMQKP